MSLEKRFLEKLYRIAKPWTLQPSGSMHVIFDEKNQFLASLWLKFDQQNCVRLGLIAVNKPFRRSGVATELVALICSCADRLGTEIDLEVSPHADYGDDSPPLDRNGLIRFYGSFGFRMEEGDRMLRPALASFWAQALKASARVPRDASREPHAGTTEAPA